MNEIIAYFETIPSQHRAAILGGGIAFFWLFESVFPFFKFQYNKWQHAGINLFFTFTTIVINFLLAFILLYAANWADKHDFGLLNWLPEMPIVMYSLVGLLVLDLVGAYAVHYVEHRWYPLWRFHLIHHTDTFVDTTSANRHHPGESVIRFIFTTIGVLLVGSPMWLVFAYQTLSVIFTQFNHANIVLPRKLDLVLSYFIVSPDMHKIHHHYQLPYTDSNYGNIFSIWDRLFGTYRYKNRNELIYGIDTHSDPKENNALGNLLKIPFQPIRKPDSV